MIWKMNQINEVNKERESYIEKMKIEEIYLKRKRNS